MALRKIVVAVDCADDAQRDEVQRIMNEVSALRMFDGGQLVRVYPFVKAHERELVQLFKIVSQQGVRGLMSGAGGYIGGVLRCA